MVLIGIPAALLLARRTVSARVLEKQETIRVNKTNGEWQHEFTVRVTTPDRAPAPSRRDTVSVTVGRGQYDATRFGAHASISYLAFAPGLAWLLDSASMRTTFARMLDDRRASKRTPTATSPLDAQTAGLARVMHVHRVRLSSASGSSTVTPWIHLVEVEFWAQRVRSLVRTIDVIDAGSIPGLQPGDVVQMHYDPREPRTMRLDDGARTFAGAASGHN